MVVLGDIVLARFPFTDLTGDKRRPALVVSADRPVGPDVIVCFITTVARVGSGTVPMPATAATGLKSPSFVRFDKVATLDRSVISGKIGHADPAWLADQCSGSAPSGPEPNPG